MKAVIIDFNRTLYDPDKDKLIDGAKELIELLKSRNIILGLISTREFGRCEKIDTISSFFSFIRLVREKSTDDLEDFLENFNLYPRDVFVIGDRIKKEITLGNKLGMRTFWLCSGKFSEETPSFKEERPNKTFYSLRDITMFLKSRNLLGDIK